MGAVLRRMLAVVAMVACAAGVSAADNRTGPEPGPGVLLYAAPHLMDPNFGQTVVLIAQYDPRGAQGVVINSPTRIRAAEALPTIEGIDRFELPVFYGGPVRPERVLALIRHRGPVERSVEVIDDVHFTGSLDELTKALERSRPNEHIRLFVGYAGWGPGQLDDELERGDWYLERAEAESLFSERPEELWKRVYQLQERIEVRHTAPAGGVRAALDPPLPRLNK